MSDWSYSAGEFAPWVSPRARYFRAKRRVHPGEFEDEEPVVKRFKEEEPPPVLVGKDQAIEHPGRMGDVEDEEDAALIATEEKGKEHLPVHSISSSSSSVGVPRGSEAGVKAVENLMGLRNVVEKRYVYNGLQNYEVYKPNGGLTDTIELMNYCDAGSSLVQRNGNRVHWTSILMRGVGFAKMVWPVEDVPYTYGRLDLWVLWDKNMNSLTAGSGYELLDWDTVFTENYGASMMHPSQRDNIEVLIHRYWIVGPCGLEDPNGVKTPLNGVLAFPIEIFKKLDLWSQFVAVDLQYNHTRIAKGGMWLFMGMTPQVSGTTNTIACDVRLDYKINFEEG